jgi:DNA modification methylase
VPAKDLMPNPRNWRTHPPEQVDAMRGLLNEIGWADAVLAREVDGKLELIDGHLRKELAPDAEVPVLVLDVDEAEADKILATHDPIAALATADEQRLGELLQDMSVEDEAVQAMLDDLAAEHDIDLGDEPAEDPGAEIDKAAELQEKWGTELGQVWVVEGKTTHQVACGDATDAGVVERLLDGAVPFLMVTDPPYGVDYDPAWRTVAADQGQIKGPGSSRGTVQNDDRVDWTDAYKLFPGVVAYVWHADRFTADIVVNLRAAEYEIRSQIIWRKSSFAISRGHYHWQHEPCWYAVRKGSAKWCGDRSQSTIWDIPHVKNETGHGTEKPVECMARPIRNHGDKDDIVYDPFLGSGTTLVACEQLGRRGFGIEIEPKYVAVSLERLSQMGCECRLE